MFILWHNSVHRTYTMDITKTGITQIYGLVYGSLLILVVGK